jgi:hypothetical protein
MFYRLAAALIAVLLLSAAASPAPILRESRQVMIAGKTEQWQLVWETMPKPICGPDDPEMAMTCPCTGFAYGEMGDLTLQRKRGGRVIDRLALGEYFSDLPASDSDGLAAMQWRPFRTSDVDVPASRLLARVKARPGPRVMQLADYDRDGTASEFLVQVSAGPCGHTAYVAVGFSRAHPRLHALGTARNPASALVMAGSAWQALLETKGEARATVWPCGDHGAEERGEMVLSTRNGVISASLLRYSCPDDGAPEVLLGREEM